MKMHSLFLGMLFIFGLALATCTPIPLCPAATVEQAQQAEAALADFAVNLYKTILSKDQTKNQVLSPVSIALALAMLENGADAKTRQQLKDALVGVGASTDVLTSYRAIQKQLRIDDEQTKLTIANGLFQDKDLELKDSYVSKTRDCLETQIDNKNDFANQLEQTRQKINKWVSEKTSGKIPELFKEGVLTQDDRMVLANAIYFKASWKNSFNKAMTKHQTFYKHGQDKDVQTVPFMRENADMLHGSFDQVDALQLAFQHPDLGLYVLLPKVRNGLSDFEQRLTGQQLKSIITKLSKRPVNVQMPKFIIRSPTNLKEVLTKMGLDDMFTNMANFSRMSETPLKVDSAIHEAYINVNENGTEAAAATGISITPRSMPIAPVDPVAFVADHPFLYALVHKETNAIVFMGRVTSIDAHNEQ